MNYTLRKRRNVRQTRKRGGAPPNNSIRQWEQKKRLLAQGVGKRRLIPKGVKFPNVVGESISTVKEFEVNSPNAKFNPVVRRSTTVRGNSLRNFGLSPGQIARKGQYNQRVAEIYANVQSKANTANEMIRLLYFDKRYKNIPRNVKMEIGEKIEKNFGNHYVQNWQ